jgi:hypothetical protein
MKYGIINSLEKNDNIISINFFELKKIDFYSIREKFVVIEKNKYTSANCILTIDYDIATKIGFNQVRRIFTSMVCDEHCIKAISSRFVYNYHKTMYSTHSHHDNVFLYNYLLDTINKKIELYNDKPVYQFFNDTVCNNKSYEK